MLDITGDPIRVLFAVIQAGTDGELMAATTELTPDLGSAFDWAHAIATDDGNPTVWRMTQVPDVLPLSMAAPRVVCLCGSTRFYDAFQQANYDLTMQGHIVLSVGFYPHAKAEHGHGEGVGHDSAEKVALDDLHKRKIDLADEILVLNVNGYVGESTRSEVEYARARGKPVRYLEPAEESSGVA